MLLSFPWAARQLVNLPVYSDAVDLRDLRCFVGGRVFSDLGRTHSSNSPYTSDICVVHNHLGQVSVFSLLFCILLLKPAVAYT